MNNSLFSLIIDEHFEMPGAFAITFTGSANKLVINTKDDVLCFADGDDSFHN